MITYADSLLIALAAFAILGAWFHEGGILEEVRQRIENWGLSHEGKSTLFARVKYRIGQLLTCSFCLAFHVVFWLSVLLYFYSWFRLPLLLLAAVKVVHWLAILESYFNGSNADIR